MKKVNTDVTNLLAATDVQAYELYKELGICATTYKKECVKNFLIKSL